jgi:ribonuclease III
MSEPRAYERLEGQLSHTFRDKGLLESALTHKSFLNENAGLERTDNERLEFLGDAVLNLAVSHLLMETFPHLQEGELSIARSKIVSEQGLYDVALRLSLGEWLFLGRGEEHTGGRRKPSVLADAVEALLAAVYLDGGFGAALDVVRALLGPRLSEGERTGAIDFKTRLQERLQAQHKETPRYSLVATSGPDHEKTFQVAVSLSGQEIARAEGKSKKEAEQRAAEKALAVLEASP